MSRLVGLLLCAMAVMASAEARLLSFRWDVKRGLDHNKKLAITINGETPGPVVQAQQGDTIVVEVTNRFAQESLAINWRGLRQIGTPSCGGANGPISAGETCTFRFVADQAGKYLYQSEFQMQKEAGLYGTILVFP